MGDLKYTIWHSPFGWIGLAANVRGMVAITSPRPSRRAAKAELEMVIGGRASICGNPHIRRTRTELDRYFRNDSRANFRKVRLDPDSGTPFQRKVWRQLRKVPYGETRTYSDLARLVGRPGAARAVGRCNAENPWAIVVPCHRVIGKDASLTGYAGGLEMKRRLLELEGIDVTALRATMLAAAPGRKRKHADRD